jgi:exopolysaccharide production protein ExoQ
MSDPRGLTRRGGAVAWRNDWERERPLSATAANERFLSGRTWMAVLGLFALFFILTPYDLLSAVSGYSLAERHGEIDLALDTVEGGNMVRRVTVLVLFLAGVIALVVSRRESRRHNLLVATAAAAFLLLALISPSWGDDAAFTIRKVVVLLILAVSSYGLARLWDFETIARVTFVLTAMSIGVGIVAEGVLGTIHPLDPEYRFRGLSHPNSMGQLCALFVISSAVLAKRFVGRRSAIMLIVGAVGLGLLLLTKARGALAGASVALGFLVLSTVDRRVLLLLGSVMGSALLGLVIFVPGFSAGAQELVALGRSQGTEVLTLTGRTDLWHDLLGYAAQRPFFGYGYDSFWVPARILEIARSQGWIIGSSHSGYIDVLIGLGEVGLVLFLALLVSCLCAAIALRRRTGSAGSCFAVAILLWLYTNMFTEVIWFETSIPSFVALLVVCRLALRETPDPVMNVR